MATGGRTGRPSPVRLGTVAMLALTSSTTNSCTAQDCGPLQPERGVKAARLFLVGQEYSRPPEAGYSLPRSRSPIKETRRGKATVIAPEAAHCSHACLNKALVIIGEATVSSRRQDPMRWGRPVDRVAGSRRDPAAGGEAGERRH